MGGGIYNMMLSLLVKVLEDLIPEEKIKFQIGFCREFNKKIIKGIIITVEPTLAAIDIARKIKANLIICYHPLYNRNLNQINENLSGKLLILIQSRIGICVLNSKLQIIDCLSKILNLNLVCPIIEDIRNNSDFILCNLYRFEAKNKPFSEFLFKIKRFFGSGSVKFYKANENSLEKVALIIGTVLTRNLISRLYFEGCTCIITDNISYIFASLIRNLKISIIEISSYLCVKLYYETLARYLSIEFPRINIEFFDSMEILKTL